MQLEKFPLNSNKNLFNMRVLKCYNKLPRGHAISILGSFQNWSGHFLCKLILLASILGLNGTLIYMTSRGPSYNSTFFQYQKPSFLVPPLSSFSPDDEGEFSSVLKHFASIKNQLDCVGTLFRKFYFPLLSREMADFIITGKGIFCS